MTPARKLEVYKRSLEKYLRAGLTERAEIQQRLIKRLQEKGK